MAMLVWFNCVRTGSRNLVPMMPAVMCDLSDVVKFVDEVASYFVFDISWDNVEIKR